LWVMTVIGLCIGGGQLGLGTASTLLSVLTLWTLKWLDVRMSREQHARIIIESDLPGSPIDEFPNAIAPLGFSARLESQSRSDTESRVRLGFDITWKRPETAGPPLDLFKIANDRFCAVSLELISHASVNE
jgi:putative Mg2+ transporter-C (MgtC) family protein